MKASDPGKMVRGCILAMHKPETGKGWKFLAFIVAVVVLTGCSHTPDPAPSWGFQEKGIRMIYTADKNLNVYGDKPHTVLLTLYQMSDPNPFSKLANYQDGLKKLLEGKDVDPTVTAVLKVFVEPGESKTIEWDRTEKTKWIGVVAGYYSLDSSRVSKVFEIPHTVETHGFFKKKKVATVPTFELHLVLGPQSIQEKKPQ